AFGALRSRRSLLAFRALWTRRPLLAFGSRLTGRASADGEGSEHGNSRDPKAHGFIPPGRWGEEFSPATQVQLSTAIPARPRPAACGGGPREVRVLGASVI